MFWVQIEWNSSCFYESVFRGVCVCLCVCTCVGVVRAYVSACKCVGCGCVCVSVCVTVCVCHHDLRMKPGTYGPLGTAKIWKDTIHLILASLKLKAFLFYKIKWVSVSITPLTITSWIRGARGGHPWHAIPPCGRTGAETQDHSRGVGGGTSSIPTGQQ